MITPPLQNTVAICYQITIFILYYIPDLTCIAHFKLTDAPIKVFGIVVFTVCFKYR